MRLEGFFLLAKWGLFTAENALFCELLCEFSNIPFSPYPLLPTTKPKIRPCPF
jgi:hypothetical protein